MMRQEDENVAVQSLCIGSTLKRYKPKYRLQWMQNKGAVLVVLWSYLVNSVFHFLTIGPNLLESKKNYSGTPLIILASMTLIFPLVGCLSDSYLGRYKVVRYSTWIMWISMLVLITGHTLNEYAIGGHLSGHAKIETATFIVFCIILGIGLVGFHSIIIQLGIDQLSDATSAEITSFITSYVFTYFSSGVAFYFINRCHGDIEKLATILTLLYVAVCLTSAVCLDFVFASCLVRERIPDTTNSATLILKVLKYVCVNRNRTTDETVDTFDIAKHKFGGPFNNQHVDWVKTFLRMTVVLGIGSIAGAQIIVLSNAGEQQQLRFALWKEYSCYVQISIYYSDYLFGTVVIVFHEIFFSPLFGRCMPTVSTTSVYMAGIFFSFLRILASLWIEVCAIFEQSDPNGTSAGYKSCIGDSQNSVIQLSPVWMVIVFSLQGLCCLLFLQSAYKFVWAQSRSSMKGLTIGIMYACLGLSTMLQSAISSPFLFIHVEWSQLPLSCGIWFYMMQAVIVIIIFVFFCAYGNTMQAKSTI